MSGVPGDGGWLARRNDEAAHLLARQLVEMALDEGYRDGWAEAVEACARVAEDMDPDVLVCVNAHDRCYGTPDAECPYCERRSPIAAAIRALKGKT